MYGWTVSLLLWAGFLQLPSMRAALHQGLRASHSHSFVGKRGLSGTRLHQLWNVGSIVVVPGLQSTGSIDVPTGLAAPWHEGPSQTRDWTCVPCIGRQILNHWTTREVLQHSFKCFLRFSFVWKKMFSWEGPGFENRPRCSRILTSFWVASAIYLPSQTSISASTSWVWQCSLQGVGITVRWEKACKTPSA